MAERTEESERVTVWLGAVVSAALAGIPLAIAPGATPVTPLATALARGPFQLVPDEVLARTLASARRPAPDGHLHERIAAALERVKADYRRLATGDALRSLEDLEASELDRLACPEHRAEAAQIEIWLGVVRATNDSVAARGHFALARALDPSARLDEQFFPPKVQALFAKAHPPSGPTPVTITADPPGVDLFVDGEPAGRSPAMVTVGAGWHLVCARRFGYLDGAQRLRLTEQAPERLELAPAGRDALIAQLAKWLDRGGILDLADPLQAEAFAWASGADVVLALEAPGRLRYHSLRNPNLRGVISAQPGDGPAPLVAELTALFAPAAPMPDSRFRFELLAAGGTTFGVGSGVRGGARLGVLAPLASSSLALSVRAGWEQPSGTILLVDQSTSSTTSGLGSATAAQTVELPVEAGLRYSFRRGQTLGFNLGAGLAFVYGRTAAAQLSIPPRNATVSATPGALVLLGAQGVAGMSWRLSPRWSFVLEAGYAALAPVKGAQSTLTVTTAGTLRSEDAPFGSSDPLRNELIAVAGVAFQRD